MWSKFQNCSCFAIFKFFFVVSIAQNSQKHSVNTQRWFDNIWNVCFVCHWVDIFKVLFWFVCMLSQVIICSVSNSPKFTPTKWEQKFEVGCCFWIEAKFFRRVVSKSQFAFIDAHVQEPFFTEVSPISKPFKVCARFAEEFKFHLFKFSCSENKVSWCDFVSKWFSDLANAKRHSASCWSQNIFEVCKNALCCFRSKINCVCWIFSYTHKCFKHKVKLSDWCKVTLSTFWTLDLVVSNKFFHFFVVCFPTRDVDVQVVFCNIVSNKLVCSVTRFAWFAIHQWVGKSTQVTRCLPNSWIHQDCAVKADIVFAFCYKFLPPSFFDVVFEFYTQRTVVPCICKTAIDLTSWKYKTSWFAKVYDFFHCQILLFAHKNSPFCVFSIGNKKPLCLFKHRGDYIYNRCSTLFYKNESYLV